MGVNFMDEMNILEMQNIHKNFGGIYALKNVNFNVKKGEIHALMGENGAGKSTLMKILIGMFAPNKGEIFLNNKKVQFNCIKDALENGIAMIFQEFNISPYMTVAENIYLGREPGNKNFKFSVDYKKMNEDTTKLLEKIGVEISPEQKVGELPVAKIQLVEIAKALSFNSRIIIMDEPTSALSNKEIENLFSIIKALKQQGITVIYISHKLDEIFKICDRVTVLRDGEYIGTQEIVKTNQSELIKMMVGREIKELFPKKEAAVSDVVLEVKNLKREGEFEDISFQLRKGEILGLAGLMGAGRTEVVEAIFGYRKLDKGEIYIKGKKAVIRRPEDAIRHGIVLVPEDRKRLGLILTMSVNDNIILSALKKCIKRIFIQRKIEQKSVAELSDLLQIKMYNSKQVSSSLSGGNQQKVVVARTLFANPDIIILDEPTRGIDVKTKSEIHLLMSELACQGKAVLMVSSEMPEVLGVSDRIIVLHEGRISGEFSRAEADQEKVFMLAMGLN
jgi:ABC-type sugar transport system ATPase subunit